MSCSKLTLPTTCPGDHLLLIAVSTKYSDKKLDVTTGYTISLETPDNGPVIKQPQAIAQYLLEGTTLLQNAKLDGPDVNSVGTLIQEYVSLAANILTPNLGNITYPLYYAKPAENQPASPLIKSVLDELNEKLFLNTFLAAERLTLADLAVASSLMLAFKSGIQTPSDHRYLTRWFKTVAFQEQFIQAQGMEPLTQFPTQPLTFNGKRFGEIQKELKSGTTTTQTPATSSTPAEQKSTPPNMDPKKLAKLKAKEAAKAEKLAKLKAKQDKAKEAQLNQAQKAPKVAVKKSGPEIVHYTIEQKPGEKKSTTCDLPSSYSPKYVEAQWYSWWEKSGFFKPEYGREGKMYEDPEETFMICIPPPNVTGSLHLGHGLTSAIEDTLTRWHRMNGKITLWNPGCDHAGIATQVVVEKKLAREQGLSRHDIGREKFVSTVWDWKNEYGSKIYEQIKLLGSSCDWDRACFTMDDKLVNAVQEAFVRMEKKGVIFRSNRLVNWSTRLKSAISNLEVDKKEMTGRTLVNVPGYDQPVEVGVLIFFSYKVKGTTEKLTVATTRIETMLGDTGVAVHPEDSRYSHLVGKEIEHPFIPDRRMIIIADEMVDRDFGTGAVKITPAHDPNDFLMGKKHDLEFITIFTDEGDIVNTGTGYDGMKRFDCRRKIVDDLKTIGLYEETKDNPMSIPFCSRSKDIVEPMIKAQWFVDTKNMCERSCEVVRNGQLKIIPDTFEKTWFHWLENPQDWCISRQLWWGHRIPAYFINITGEESEKETRNAEGEYWVCSRDPVEAEAMAKAKFPGKDFTLEQDEDVLDTWFSSGLFPFSIFGWPENTQELQKFYPGSVLETGHDILFFWVARMVMFGLELTDKVPFKEVYLHAMVRDAHGRKMSKSLGNVIDPTWVIEGKDLNSMMKMLESGNLDPREVAKAKEGQRQDYPDGIPECGADAMRFALCAYTAQCRAINLDVSRVVGYRHFCNKLWNAIRFATNFCLNEYTPTLEVKISQSPVDKWILSRLAYAVKECDEGLKSYNFPQATTATHAFWLYDLCDVYLEAIKPVIYRKVEASEDDILNAKETLFICLETGLRLLAPIMPFITEELWQRLPKRGNEKESIHVSSYPKVKEFEELANPNNIEGSFDLAMAAVKAVRGIRSEYGLTNKQSTDIVIKSKENGPFEQFSVMIKTLGNGNNIIFSESFPEGSVIEIVNDRCDVGLVIKGIIDVEKELAKLTSKTEQLSKLISNLTNNMSKPHYTKVPDHVKAKDAAKLEQTKIELSKTNQAIANFTKMK